MEMNRFARLALFALSALLVYTGCDKHEEEPTESPYIEGLSIDTYPVIDGSTSTLPLNTVIACELMGLSYQWQENVEGQAVSWSMEPRIGKGLRKKFDRVVKCSQTHNSYINLIDGAAQIALTARTMSADEKQYAAEKGVTLIETPIALDAFIFIVSRYDSEINLTTKNIQDIYTGKVTDWAELDGKTYSGPAPIRPYIRNQNSGSQELMDLLIMKDLPYKDLPIYQETLIWNMAGLIDAIGSDYNAIGYTVYYYNEQIIRAKHSLQAVAIDGVLPNVQTIGNRTYPYTTEVYAVIRSDTDPSSMAYRVYEWFQTTRGKIAINKSGYQLN